MSLLVTGASGLEQNVFHALESAGKAKKLEVSTFDAHLARGLTTDRLMRRSLRHAARSR